MDEKVKQKFGSRAMKRDVISISLASAWGFFGGITLMGLGLKWTIYGI